ncbi:peptidoglycan-binding protein [Oscillatoria sp. FACHB-1407]|uniref:peptidoglycan-binding domain-containing protein n=1 Tax=Oscillatoria sp. FACHB-1407 TaxID=2692847 RepID=UPI001686054C|nr:peptidoglycan-binding domain-containing protein [Oscillatoria sp. FACHB-1407]MBD2459793.1 peptidoglycan-binding protein [Oscillatoria sp. FACHB-1407]
MRSQPASIQLRSITRSLWFKILNLAIVLSVCSWATEAIAQIYQRGDVGVEVEAIQSALGIPVDGIYGDQTESAVLRFQLANGLDADGIAGPQTLRALGLGSLTGRTLPPVPTVPYDNFYGSSGNTVGLNAPIVSTTNPYVVVIPGINEAELFQAQQLAPDAYIVPRARRGAYIRAGSFARRSEAESLSRDLRRSGLDARVAYRPR